MSIDRFKLCFPFTMSAEGGYSTDRSDSGNFMHGVLVGSKYGVTWQDIKTLYGERFTITADFMRNITPILAQKVYNILYWNVVSANSMWPGLDLVVYDFGVNAGIGTSAKELQIALGFTGDGVDDIIGPKTLAAANSVVDRVGFLTKLRDAEVEHYKTLRLWEQDGDGWTARSDDRLELALKMLKDPTLSA